MVDKGPRSTEQAERDAREDPDALPSEAGITEETPDPVSNDEEESTEVEVEEEEVWIEQGEVLERTSAAYVRGREMGVKDGKRQEQRTGAVGTILAVVAVGALLWGLFTGFKILSQNADQAAQEAAVEVINTLVEEGALTLYEENIYECEFYGWHVEYDGRVGIFNNSGRNITELQSVAVWINGRLYGNLTSPPIPSRSPMFYFDSLLKPGMDRVNPPFGLGPFDWRVVGSRNCTWEGSYDVGAPDLAQNARAVDALRNDARELEQLITLYREFLEPFSRSATVNGIRARDAIQDYAELHRQRRNLYENFVDDEHDFTKVIVEPYLALLDVQAELAHIDARIWSNTNDPFYSYVRLLFLELNQLRSNIGSFYEVLEHVPTQ